MANAKQAAGSAKPVAAPPLPASPPAPGAPAAGASMMQELKVTGHMMALPVGLFCITNEPNPTAARRGGMPGVRISPPPQDPGGVEIVGFRADGWLGGEGDAALVRIRRAQAQVLVTIYQLPDQPDAAPKLQVRQLLGPQGAPAAGGPAPNGPAPAGPVEGPAAPPAAATPTKVDILAHIQSRGDVGAVFGDWLGERGSGNWIEGFAVAAPEGIEVADISYQAVLGRGWLSPWVEAGQYCGSRGMALPLLGLRVRLTGDAAERFDITCAASFVGGASAGPVGNDETCEGAELAPLEAILITLTPKSAKSRRGKR